jgi:hypothetical protein
MDLKFNILINSSQNSVKLIAEKPIKSWYCLYASPDVGTTKKTPKNTKKKKNGDAYLVILPLLKKEIHPTIGNKNINKISNLTFDFDNIQLFLK